MRYFPIFVDFGTAQTVLVYGGGEEALCKVRLLLKTDVTINIVAPALQDELAELLHSGRIAWTAASFSPDQLDSKVSGVFSACDEVTNSAVSAAAQDRNIPVNVVDRPDLSTFIIPAIVDRDPLVIAIGTEGAGPVLAQGLRAKIEAMLAPTIGGLLKRARALRPAIAENVPAGAARRDFWRHFFFGPVRDAYLQADEAAYADQVGRGVRAASHSVHVGRISLLDVCDDPELLTLKAHRLLQEADVIVHDSAVAPGALDYARRDARRISVEYNIWSNTDGDHRQIAGQAIELAASGLRLVRLFERDGSAFETELAALRSLNSNGIAIDCVRGVQEDCTWAPLIDGPADGTANVWRLAS